MTRNEAFELARKDWKSEDDAFKESGVYSFDSETRRWLSNLDEIEELSKEVAYLADKITIDAKNDRLVLRHHSKITDKDGKNMRTIDRKNAERLVSELFYAYNVLTEFLEDANKGGAE